MVGAAAAVANHNARKWHYEKDQVVFEVAIPANVTAEIRLPDGNIVHAETGIHVFSCKA